MAPPLPHGRGSRHSTPPVESLKVGHLVRLSVLILVHTPMRGALCRALTRMCSIAEAYRRRLGTETVTVTVTVTDTADASQGAVPLRREFLLKPGEGWMLSPDLFLCAERLEDFMEVTGLTDKQVVMTPVVAVPIPSPELSVPPEGERQWSNVFAEMLWHPFFWLPDSVARRAIVADESGERPELDEEYVVRVMALCTMAGLFDVETGTWLDVLAYAGLGEIDDALIDRLMDWMIGEPDEQLDSIDLSPLFAEADAGAESHAAADVISGVPQAVEAQWALTADYIGRSVNDMRQDESATAEQKDVALGTFLVLAVAGFRGAELIGSERTQEALSQLVLDTQKPDADSELIVAGLLGICGREYVARRPALDRIGEEAEAVEAAHRGS